MSGTVQELAGTASGMLAGALDLGIQTQSQQVEIAFSTYARRVLPLDGYVFWLRTGSFTQNGVLHHSADRAQNVDETVTTNPVLFTTTAQIVRLNESQSDTLIVGEVEGLRYAFKTHGWFNEQANVWHYAGSSINAAVETQLIDDPGAINDKSLIVSDSLPAWLTIASYNPVWLVPANPMIPLYPSFLVPDNLAPPYGAVHIAPEGIRALSSVPWVKRSQLPLLDGFGKPVLDGHGNPILIPGSVHSQLVSERVEVTLYGCDNATALAWLDTVLRFSVDTNAIGLLNQMPVVRDGKRTWPEGMLIAQQKMVDFEISYVQSAMYYLATQLILHASATVMPSY